MHDAHTQSQKQDQEQKTTKKEQAVTQTITWKANSVMSIK